MLSHVTEYDGKPLQSVAKGDLDLDKIRSGKKTKKKKKETKVGKVLLERIRKALGDRVEDVRSSERLTQSPSCIVLHEHDLSLYMQQLLKQAGQEIPTSKPILEINLDHPVVKQMKSEKDEARFKEWSTLLLEEAILTEGGQLEDPAGFVHRMNDIMLALAEKGLQRK